MLSVFFLYSKMESTIFFNMFLKKTVCVFLYRPLRYHMVCKILYNMVLLCNSISIAKLKHKVDLKVESLLHTPVLCLVFTQHSFNVHLMSITFKKRWIDVQVTSSVSMAFVKTHNFVSNVHLTFKGVESTSKYRLVLTRLM